MSLLQKEVGFDIQTLLLLEKHLNVPIDNILFNIEVTDEIQAIVNMYGLRLNDNELQEYFNLASNLKLSVDLKVNGALLDAFGIGKQQNNASAEQTEKSDAKVKFFKEYIQEFMDYCVGVLHMSKADFLAYRPVDMYKVLEKHREHLKYQYNLNKLAHINAIGLTSSKKFKEISPFAEENEKRSRVKKVDKEKKKAELDFLKSR